MMWIPMHRRPNYLSNKRKRIQVTPSFLLPIPKTKKLKCENKVICGLEAGHASMQGYRVSMEDEHVIDTMTQLSDHALVAIMDGHAGSFSAEFASVHLKTKIEETDQWKQYAQLSSEERKRNVELISRALVQAYINLDEDLKGLKDCGIMDESGCTLVCAIVTPSHIVCANVGDSRCVLGCKDQVISLTEDHKPSIYEEEIRIEKAGGFVKFDRVNGELAMSRAIGDFRYKQSTELQIHEHLVICLPDVSVHERRCQEEVMVLACDGVWDVISNEEAISFITNIVLDESTMITEDAQEETKKAIGFDLAKKLKFNGGNHITSQEIAESLIDLALKDGSTDNISAVVVRFNR